MGENLMTMVQLLLSWQLGVLVCGVIWLLFVCVTQRRKQHDLQGIPLPTPHPAPKKK